MGDIPGVHTCANTNCHQEFRRLGDGKLYAFTVDDPQNWGLPAHLKQKVVWLCSACAGSMYVRLDRRRHRVQLVHHQAETHSHAAGHQDGTALKWIDVDSTSISGIGYDKSRRVLGIEFLPSAKAYLYFDVPPEEHQALMRAESKGEYLNRVFKPKGYRYEGPLRGRWAA
jgi:hypothetical protein